MMKGRETFYGDHPIALRTAKTMGFLPFSSTHYIYFYLTLLHSERPKLWSFDRSECNRVNSLCKAIPVSSNGMISRAMLGPKLGSLIALLC